MESSRVSLAKEEIGLNDLQEQKSIDKSIEKEKRRLEKKAEDKLLITESQSYKSMHKIAKVMDKWFLDVVLGLIPGIGDILSSFMSLPFIYVSLFKIGSIPLTLAVLYNILKDAFIGMIPFWIGDILDAFNRSYLQNLRLIVGFVEDDKEIIKEVNKKAVKSIVGILIFSLLIYILISIVASVISWISGLFS